MSLTPFLRYWQFVSSSFGIVLQRHVPVISRWVLDSIIDSIVFSPTSKVTFTVCMNQPSRQRIKRTKIPTKTVRTDSAIKTRSVGCSPFFRAQHQHSRLSLNAVGHQQGDDDKEIPCASLLPFECNRNRKGSSHSPIPKGKRKKIITGGDDDDGAFPSFLCYMLSGTCHVPQFTCDVHFNAPATLVFVYGFLFFK